MHETRAVESREAHEMRRGTVPVRGYAVTRWSRAFVDVVEGRTDIADATGAQRAGSVTESADSRRISKARRYFRDRHVHRLSIRPGQVTASVEGSQLEPFDVILSMRTVDVDTVATLLRSRAGVAEVMSVARGEQPPIVGELLGPTESADVASQCTCPDESVRCIHVLAVAYEVAAEIDRSPLTLFTVMGTDLPSLLDALGNDSGTAPDESAEPNKSGANGQSKVRDGSAEHDDLGAGDFFGTRAPLPPLPRPPRGNPLTDLDGTALRAALRASGVAPGDIAEAVDELGDLYDRLVQE